MRKKIFTILLALVASVGMSWADTYVTITQNDFPQYGGNSFTKDGVTVSVGNIDPTEGFLMNGGSFSTTLGNFTKIEVNAGVVDISGEGWSGDSERQTWTGNASSVSFSGDIRSKNQGVTIMFTIGDPAPTYTVALKAGTVNADKVTLSATSAVEGATVTVTPNEEYEIKAFKATYNTTEEAASTLDPGTGAYSFTMPAYDVTIEATIVLKPVPEGDIFAGFTATAGADGFGGEDYSKLVDGKFISSDWTKWCANDGHKSIPTGESESCWWIDFEASAALSLTGYILTTGNDTGSEQGRNPKNWVLKAKLNADDAWTTIATVTNDVTMKDKSFKDYKFFVDQSGSYQYFRFEVFANQGANVMQLCELRLIGSETPADVKLYHNFYGDWMETEAFGIFDDYTSEYAKISMILEPGDYQFALKVGGELRGDGTALSRDKQACILAEGLTANLTLNVDVKGTYRFYWFYEENRFAMDVPNVCGMYWKNVTDDKFEVTLGKESEVTLPTVYTTNMGFATNIFNGVDQVRLVSTDETVATIEYTISLDGLGTITIHKAGECDIYAVHDITDYYCYDSVAFHLTVLPESTPEPTPTVWTALKVGDVIKLGDKIEVPAEGDGWGINGNILRNAWGPYTLIRADIVQEHEYDDPEVTETEDGAYYVFKAEHDDFYPLSNLGKGTGLVVTGTSDGLVVTNVGDLGMPVFTVAVHDNGGATAIDEISQGQTCKSQKLIKDGQLLIIRDGKTYTVTGQQVR